MRQELFSYEQLCEKYGKEIIDPLDTFIYWQLQYKGNITFLGKEYTFEEYLEVINKKAAPFAGYDYEDDSFAFNQWYQHQAELEYNRQAEIE